MELINCKLCILIVLGVTSTTVYANKCIELSPALLAKIHGQAFNARYMRIYAPIEEMGINGKRSPNDIPFYAEDDITHIGDLPAWETNHQNIYETNNEYDSKIIGGDDKPEYVVESDLKITSERNRSRHVRAVSSNRQRNGADLYATLPWKCSSRVEWIDLGMNYFPRYIRTVECLSHDCWYNMFECKPKAFTIKVLQRKHGVCTKKSKQLQLLTSGNFDVELIELWVWEEMKINFCCDCVFKK